MRRIFSLIFIVLFLVFLPKSVFAAKICTITVDDESGKTLDKVQVSLIFANSPTQYANPTGKPGEYTFTVSGLGPGFGTVNAIKFEKESYQYKIFDYVGDSKDPYAIKQSVNVCPGAPDEKTSMGTIQLSKSPTTPPKKLYGCYKGFCSEIDYESKLEPDKIYDDEKSEASCKADCGFYELKEPMWCNPNRPNSYTHFTKSACEADLAKKKLPEGQKEALYIFNPITKTCQQTTIPNDPKGLSKEECNKKAEESMKTLVTFPPPPPPCKTWEGEKCVVVDTAIGDFNTDPAKFAGKLMGIILGLSGGIAVLLIIVSGYRFMASQGNPEKVQAAREGLTSAIVGLLFIIFSIVILKIIGIDILHLPGFEP